ncbi:MAG: hypothetical protein WD076_11615 [Parvularculaceae bacterium]
MNTIFKAAVSVFAFVAMSEAAFAEEAHAVDARAVLDNIFAAVEKNRTKTTDFVLASAEARMAERMNDVGERKEKPAASFLVASN